MGDPVVGPMNPGDAPAHLPSQTVELAPRGDDHGGTRNRSKDESSSSVLVQDCSGGESNVPSRVLWVDHLRGLTICFMGLSFFFPPRSWAPEGSFLFFLLEHPSSHANYMTAIDVVTPAFIYLIGLSMSLSFIRRRKIFGIKGVLKHFGLRYGLLLLAGMLSIWVPSVSFYKIKQNMVVITWDVVPAIGLSGIVAFPFCFLKRKIRFFAGYAWVFFYQILMVIPQTGMKEYAKESVHGGIFGTIFGFGGLVVLATVHGECLFLPYSRYDTKKCRKYFLYGAVNIVVGVALSFIPQMEGAKRQVSFTYVLISMGWTIVVACAFAWVHERKKWEIQYLQALGKNCFLVYTVAIVMDVVVSATDIDEFGIPEPTGEWLGSCLWTIIVYLLFSVLAVVLHAKKIYVKTEHIAGAWVGVLTLGGIILGSIGLLPFYD